jgi:predicted  nucleic acid-binding Zn-ribbon protein
MREHPQKIEELQLQIADLNRDLDDVREKVATREALMTIEIVTARDETGKPLYSNESMRAAAVTLAKNNSEELRNLWEQENNFEYKKSELFARLERLRLEFKLYLIERQEEINRQ